MATITSHCKMGIVDKNGNVTMICIETVGDAVIITPNDVVKATTLQALVDSLKASAFIPNFLGIDDNSEIGENVTYSVKKINEMYKEINEKLPFSLTVKNNVYGYTTSEGEFIPFNS